MTSSTVIAATARIDALALAFHNTDAADIRDAASNIANGCPAFWHKASGGNAVVGGFMFYLNRTQDVRRAWVADEAAFQRPSRMRDPALLDRLLPLNVGAIASLAAAYEDLGTFRTHRELLDRVCDAEEYALDALAALRAAPEHPLVTAMGGIDHGRIAASVEAITSPANIIHEAA
jgi:hypothetical protein